MVFGDLDPADKVTLYARNGQSQLAICRSFQQMRNLTLECTTIFSMPAMSPADAGG